MQLGAEMIARVAQHGMGALTPDETEIYTIQCFVNEFESNGLSGYFYNTLPDLDGTRAVVQALRRRQFDQVADPLACALNLFQNYSDPSPPSTWFAVLRLYDPLDQLDTFDAAIGRAIDQLGL